MQENGVGVQRRRKEHAWDLCIRITQITAYRTDTSDYFRFPLCAEFFKKSKFSQVLWMHRVVLLTQTPSGDRGHAFIMQMVESLRTPHATPNPFPPLVT